MNIFESIGHSLSKAAHEVKDAVAGFFSHLFGGDGDFVQKAVEGIAGLEKVAATVVTDLHVIAPNVNNAKFSEVIGKVTAYIEKHIPDANLVKSFLASVDGLPVSDLLLKAAQLIVGYLQPGSSTTDLIMAVITAYKVLKLKQV